MKETIYTIPLSEALEENGECAFCFLEDKLEKEQIEYALGPAMMEPDYRILSNEKGFCRRHIEKMARAKKALPLALVLDTRADEVLKVLESVRPEEGKGGLFGKKGSGYEKLTETAKKLSCSCLVCERIEATAEKFYHTFWYLYSKEPDFKNRVLSSKGFCLHHFAGLLSSMDKVGGKKEQFAKELYELEMKALSGMKEDVHGFTKQFDYRADKENWQGPKDAHLLAAARLSQSFERD
ncbi:MAG: hypothetical protein IJC78_06170 [Clostridia bacterium]|nr:hypothetical protein [Clostridia bacterium]